MIFTESGMGKINIFQSEQELYDFFRHKHCTGFVKQGLQSPLDPFSQDKEDCGNDDQRMGSIGRWEETHHGQPAETGPRGNLSSHLKVLSFVNPKFLAKRETQPKPTQENQAHKANRTPDLE